MQIKVRDLRTGEVVFETANPINLGITFDGEERLVVSGNEQSVSTYFRDPRRKEAVLSHSFSGFGELVRMTI